MSTDLCFMMKLPASITHPFTSTEYISGAGPTASTTQPGGCSDETASVASTPIKVRSLSFDVTTSDFMPSSSARRNIVSEPMYSADSTYKPSPISLSHL